MSKRNLKADRDTYNWQEALGQFLWWKQAGGVSKRTLEDYERYIKGFFKYYPQAFVNSENLKNAVYEYMSKPAKPAYYNLKLVYLKAFFQWCVNEGYLSENPLSDFKRRRAEGKIINIDNDTIKELISLPDKKTFAGLRDYSLILLTLDTGIRPSESFSLLIPDVNFKGLEIYVRSDYAKTRISRTLPICVITAKAIHDLISVRHPSWDDSVPLFCTVEGKRMNRFTWEDRLNKYSKKLGVKITPYALRHVFALTFLRNGGNVFALQRILGHSDLTMTKKYIALLNQDIKEQHLNASPLNVLVPKKVRIRKI